jgi:hypothetical protein
LPPAAEGVGEDHSLHEASLLLLPGWCADGGASRAFHLHNVGLDLVLDLVIDPHNQEGPHRGINSLIQAAIAKARVCLNPQNLITIAYLIAGKLDFNTNPTRISLHMKHRRSENL